MARLFDWANNHPLHAAVVMVFFFTMTGGGFFAREAVVSTQEIDSMKTNIQVTETNTRELAGLGVEVKLLKEVMTEDRHTSREKDRLILSKMDEILSKQASTDLRLQSIEMQLTLQSNRLDRLEDRFDRLEEHQPE